MSSSVVGTLAIVGVCLGAGTSLASSMGGSMTSKGSGIADCLLRNGCFEAAAPMESPLITGLRAEPPELVGPPASAATPATAFVGPPAPPSNDTPPPESLGETNRQVLQRLADKQARGEALLPDEIAQARAIYNAPTSNGNLRWKYGYYEKDAIKLVGPVKAVVKRESGNSDTGIYTQTTRSVEGTLKVRVNPAVNLAVGGGVRQVTQSSTGEKVGVVDPFGTAGLQTPGPVNVGVQARYSRTKALELSIRGERPAPGAAQLPGQERTSGPEATLTLPTPTYNAREREVAGIVLHREESNTQLRRIGAPVPKRSAGEY